MIIFKDELGNIIGTSPKNHINNPFRTDAETAEIGYYDSEENWVKQQEFTNTGFVGIDIDKYRQDLKNDIQLKTEELINNLTFEHPSNSNVVFSGSMSASALWDKLDAKKETTGFFPLSKTQHNDEIHSIVDVEEFDSITDALFLAQKPIWDASASLKQSLNSMTLQELKDFTDNR